MLFDSFFLAGAVAVAWGVAARVALFFHWLLAVHARHFFRFVTAQRALFHTSVIMFEKISESFNIENLRLVGKRVNLQKRNTQI